MAKLSELPGILTAYGDKLDKIIKEVQTLKNSLGDVELPAAAQSSLDRLGGLIQTADDLNPDVEG